MINSVAGINKVIFFDNFVSIGVVASILIWRVMYVTGQENTRFFFHFAIHNKIKINYILCHRVLVIPQHNTYKKKV